MFNRTIVVRFARNLTVQNTTVVFFFSINNSFSVFDVPEYRTNSVLVFSAGSRYVFAVPGITNFTPKVTMHDCYYCNGYREIQRTRIYPSILCKLFIIAHLRKVLMALFCRSDSDMAPFQKYYYYYHYYHFIKSFSEFRVFEQTHASHPGIVCVF